MARPSKPPVPTVAGLTQLILATPISEAAEQLDDATMDALATWLRNVRSARIAPTDRNQVTPRFKTGK